MKKKSIIILSSSILIILLVGLIFYFKGVQQWQKGIYFRHNYSYLGYVEGSVTFNLYYYNVRDAEEDFSDEKTSILLIDDDAKEISIKKIDVITLQKTKNYIEKSLKVELDIEHGKYTFNKLKILSDGKTVNYSIGNITIEKESQLIKTPVNSQITYSLIFAVDLYDITIENMGKKDLFIEKVKIENPYCVYENPLNILLKEKEKYKYSLTLNNESVSKFDVIQVKPLIIYMIADETGANSIKVISTQGSVSERYERLISTDVYEFVNLRSEEYANSK